MRIKKGKPIVSPTARQFRAIKRLNQNPTYISLKAGPILNMGILAALAGTSTMSGISFGVFLRLMGL
jgi:hypothetical protein